MKVKLFTIFFTILMMASSALAQTSWLDRPLTNWNSNTGAVPTAPRATGDAPTNARCPDAVRNPESIADRAVTRAGWSLFGALQSYGAVTVINGMASLDGMCRPLQYNTFVFVSNRFAGTLSPTAMNSRTDGALSQARLNSPTNISADFTRYTSSDALCCPSQTSSVFYTITSGRVAANDVNTEATCQQNQNEPDNPNESLITGQINYTPRVGRQRNSTITIRLVDVTQVNANPNIIAEQQIEVNQNQQFPMNYELKYEPSRINQRNRYTIQAEMVSNNRTIAKTETVYPVLTERNPNTVDITLVPSGAGNQQNNSLLRGTVAYREKILLPNNASITVKLFDASAAETSAAPIAETTFSSNNRQVPIPFELGYSRNQIDLNRRYTLRAEISLDGKVAWATETNVAVLSQNSAAAAGTRRAPAPPSKARGVRPLSIAFA